MRVFLFTVLLCLQLALAAAANVPLMPVRDIQPGMQGIGKTVISGDTIEEFNVEILGVSGTQATGYNIFARLYGDLIDKTGGVAQGMSGSPVYVDGRLVGAVAFGKTFNDPHYCFLTPIGRMLPLLDEQRSVPADWHCADGRRLYGVRPGVSAGKNCSLWPDGCGCRRYGTGEQEGAGAGQLRRCGADAGRYVAGCLGHCDLD